MFLESNTYVPLVLDFLLFLFYKCYLKCTEKKNTHEQFVLKKAWPRIRKTNCVRIGLFYGWNETSLWFSSGMPRILVPNPGQDKHGIWYLVIYNLLFKCETPLETPYTSLSTFWRNIELWFTPVLTGYTD